MAFHICLVSGVINRRWAMKAGVIFTGTGPILILTTYETFMDEKFIEKLGLKGIKKFMAYEVSLASKRMTCGFWISTVTRYFIASLSEILGKCISTKRPKDTARLLLFPGVGGFVQPQEDGCSRRWRKGDGGGDWPGFLWTALPKPRPGSLALLLAHRHT